MVMRGKGSLLPVYSLEWHTVFQLFLKSYPVFKVASLMQLTSSMNTIFFLSGILPFLPFLIKEKGLGSSSPHAIKKEGVVMTVLEYGEQDVVGYWSSYVDDNGSDHHFIKPLLLLVQRECARNSLTIFFFSTEPYQILTGWSRTAQ